MKIQEISLIHQDVVSRVKNKMPPETVLLEVAELFKVFGDTTRTRMICALRMEEMCVNDLAALLCMNQSAVSHQLKILRDARLVRYRKQGRVAYYALDDKHIEQIFSMAFDHVMEKEDEIDA